MLRTLLCITVFALPGILLAGGGSGATAPFPTPLDAYGDADFIQQGKGLGDILLHRIQHDPFNLYASLVFLLAILHTFAAGKVAHIAHQIQHEHEVRMRALGKPEHEIENTVPIRAEVLHFFGEIEAIFGLWILILAAVSIHFYDWNAFKHYIVDTVSYPEPMFVVVIMSLASTRPVLKLSEQLLGVLAGLGRHTPAAWWLSILTLAPILGSFITEPAAMTIAALMLAKQFYDLKPPARLAYATIGLLFVNVSVGGTITHFAAPPVLMVAAPWDWTLGFMAAHFGWKAFLGIVISNALYYLVFRRDFAQLQPTAVSGAEEQTDWEDREDPVPVWITLVHLLFMGWTVVNAHYPPLFIGGFLFFLGFAIATKQHQNRVDLKPAMLVGFFLAGFF